MTARIPDRLIHGGKTLDLCATPLEPYLARLSKRRRPRFEVTCTANWRGYVATWAFIERRLHLVDIEGLVGDEVGGFHEASLARCFPHRNHPIRATWVTNELRCPEGRLRAYVHRGFLSEYELNRVFRVANGELHEEWLIFNPPAPLHYRIKPDGGRTYFSAFVACPEHRAPDPFAADEPIRPWLPWGRSDWDIVPGSADDEGYVLGGLTTFAPRDRG